MGYDHTRLADEIRSRVAANPRISLALLVNALHVSRHTITRTIREYHGLTFRQLRAQSVQDAVRAELSQGRSRFVKEIAASFAYSPSSFARRVKRLTGMPPSMARRNPGREKS